MWSGRESAPDMSRELDRRTFLSAAAVGPFGVAAERSSGLEDAGFTVSADSGDVEFAWERTIEGVIYDIAQSQDGGYLLAGTTGGELEDGTSLLVKTGSEGAVEWRRTYDRGSFFLTVLPTADGYVLQRSLWDGSADVRLQKVDRSGDVQWESGQYGGSDNDVVYDTIETDDGGYALGGWTSSHTFSTYHDAWLVKTDDQGREEWSRTFGTDPAFYANAILQADDEGFVLSGGRWYDDAPRDAWILKTDATGAQQWEQTFGGAETDNVFAAEHVDDGYLFVGYTESTSDGVRVATARRVDAQGSPSWYTEFQDEPESHLASVVPLADGTILVGGQTSGGTSDGSALLAELEAGGDASTTHEYSEGTSFSRLTEGHGTDVVFLGGTGSSENTWTGAISRGRPLDELDTSHVTIEFENNFRTESTEGFLESLYAEVKKGMPTTDPTTPDENEAYIHVDVRVHVDDEFDVSSVHPVFTHDQTDETFTASNIENYLGDVEYADTRRELGAIDDNTFGWDNFRVRTPTQVGIQVIEAAVMALSAGLDHGEVTNPVQANTEAYPDVYLTALEFEGPDGDVVEVDVDERLPRYDDVCTSVGFSGLANDECSVEGLDGFQGGAMVMSPATIALEDEDGRITGRIREGGEDVIRDEIPGAQYSGATRHEFVLAPAGDYRIVVDGQEEGTATVVVDQIDAGTVQTDAYRDVDVTESVRIERSLDDEELSIDRERDGTVDETVSPDDTGRQRPADLFDVRSDHGRPRTFVSDAGEGSAGDSDPEGARGGSIDVEGAIPDELEDSWGLLGIGGVVLGTLGATYRLIASDVEDE